jgi:hypothetical protein
MRDLEDERPRRDDAPRVEPPRPGDHDVRQARRGSSKPRTGHSGNKKQP